MPDTNSAVRAPATMLADETTNATKRRKEEEEGGYWNKTVMSRLRGLATHGDWRAARRWWAVAAAAAAAPRQQQVEQLVPASAARRSSVCVHHHQCAIPQCRLLSGVIIRAVVGVVLPAVGSSDAAAEAHYGSQQHVMRSTGCCCARHPSRRVPATLQHGQTKRSEPPTLATSLFLPPLARAHPVVLPVVVPVRTAGHGCECPPAGWAPALGSGCTPSPLRCSSRGRAGAC